MNLLMSKKLLLNKYSEIFLSYLSALLCVKDDHDIYVLKVYNDKILMFDLNHLYFKKSKRMHIFS